MTIRLQFRSYSWRLWREAGMKIHPEKGDQSTSRMWGSLSPHTVMKPGAARVVESRTLPPASAGAGFLLRRNGAVMRKALNDTEQQVLDLALEGFLDSGEVPEDQRDLFREIAQRVAEGEDKYDVFKDLAGKALGVSEADIEAMRSMEQEGYH